MAFQVKQFKDLVVDYDAPAGATVTIYTDMPGAMAQRKSSALPATVGRTTFPVPLDGIEGTLIRVSWASNPANVTRLYAAVVRLRSVGVYIDGTKGEVWSTSEMGFGV